MKATGSEFRVFLYRKPSGILIKNADCTEKNFMRNNFHIISSCFRTYNIKQSENKLCIIAFLTSMLISAGSFTLSLLTQKAHITKINSITVEAASIVLHATASQCFETLILGASFYAAN
jgi:hypothetical protein